MDDKYIVLDLETTVKNTIGNNKASAFCPDNWIVMGGEIVQGYTPTISNKRRKEDYIRKEMPFSTLIGQNVKFDIHHLRKNGLKWDEWLREGGHVWDTQLAEYLLTGQQSTFASLDDLATKYGGTLKPDVIKEMWNAGVQTEDMDEELLGNYLKGDVENTELVALKQMQAVYDSNMLPLVQTQMDALLAVEEMEYNGMALDMALLARLQVEHTLELHRIVSEFDNEMHYLYPDVPYNEWNMGSAQQLGTIFFGGTIEWSTREPDGLYKNGNPKSKKVVHGQKIEPRFTPEPEWKNKNGWSVSEQVLDKLKAKYTDPILDLILKHRKLKKELTTYVEGLQDLVFPDGLIHHNLNQVVTKTGRLSSSDPNLQNIPSNDESEIKKAFVSRWGKDGVIIEADYKQLEVIALAFLTGDPTLIDDIVNGRDLHYETGKAVFGWKSPKDMNKDDRRVVKGVNFALIYGAGAQAAADNTGVDIKIARACIEAFYARYPQVKVWQEKVAAQVRASRITATHKTEKGMPAGTGTLVSLTGRRYVFKEYDAPEWIGMKTYRAGGGGLAPKTTFSPTEMKNYPVQGFATGDIVPMVMGRMLRVLKSSPIANECLMINQVHDALLFDCRKDFVNEAYQLIKETMESAPQMLKEIFGIDFNLPLTVEVSAGPNWKEQEKL